MTMFEDSTGFLIERHEILCVNGVRYLLEPVRDLTPIIDSGTTLTTVVNVGESQATITAGWITRWIEHSKEIDNVFQVQFLRTVLFGGCQNQTSLAPDAQAILEGVGMQSYHFLDTKSGVQPSPGPYVLLEGTMYEALRLYTDTHAAFFSATRKIPGVDESGDNYGQIDIAVSSRLKSHASLRLPMSGIRVAVKDNFDVKGMKTLLCSRPYLQTYPGKAKSATCIQRLVDLGAEIVGKTKLCAFAQWEEPTEVIEYTSPWSPRADGFQSSGGSSNGSGAAIAAYEWLDSTIGSDTTGSILRPALWNGCFSLRPTFGHLSTEGFVSCIQYLDTPGIMGRDLQKCRDFAASWYGDGLSCASSNVRVLSAL